jgi:hypothetical protein
MLFSPVGYNVAQAAADFKAMVVEYIERRFSHGM